LKTLSKTSSNIPDIGKKLDQEKEQKMNSNENHKATAKGDTDYKEESPEKQSCADHKQTGIKVALDRVYREKSVGGDIQVPKELSSHLLSLSSANISEELRRSCSNIVSRSMDREMSKEYLLKRLGDLLSQEKEQLSSDLLRRKEQLEETRTSQAEEIEALDKRHKEELRKLRSRNAQKFAELECDYLDQVENLKKELELLENERAALCGPAELLSTGGTAVHSAVPGLEAELECCRCEHICKPPGKIYQCPEGDLLCETCKERLGPDTVCTRCHCILLGQVSRNKGLEKIALKYFK